MRGVLTRLWARKKAAPGLAGGKRQSHQGTVEGIGDHLVGRTPFRGDRTDPDLKTDRRAVRRFHYPGHVRVMPGGVPGDVQGAACQTLLNRGITAPFLTPRVRVVAAACGVRRAAG